MGRTALLAELCDPSRGITYGIVKIGKLGPDGIPVIRGGDIRQNRITIDPDKCVSEDVSAQFKRTILSGGEIVMNLIGEPGHTAIVPSSLRGANVTRDVAVIPVDKADSRFVNYFLQSPQCVAWLRSRLQGSVTLKVNLGTLARLPVPNPSLEEQQRIALVLSTLDDKIDSNGSLASLLDDTVATLFRGRFVDFIDVEEFDDSEIGHIPKGWRTGSIYEVASVTYGRSFKSELFNGDEGLPLIRIRDLVTDEPSVLTTEQRNDGRLVRPEDLVVGMDGEFRAHAWAGPDSWLNQRVCVFDPSEGVSRAFLLESIKRPLRFFEATKGGTTVIHLGKRDIDTFRVLIPPPPVMEEFKTDVDPLLTLNVALRVESRMLARTREAVLPKLISGAIRIPNTRDPEEVIGPVAEQAAA
jgi:type I restriction enzyme S subunit